MRVVRQFKQVDEANLVCDALYAEQIESEVEEEEEGCSLWILNDDDLERAENWMARNLPVSNPEELAKKAKFGRQLRAEVEKKDRAARSQYKDVRTLWAERSLGVSKVTLILMSVSILVYLLTGFGANRRLVSLFTITSLFGFGGTPDFLQGQFWRLFTPMFLHFGLLHILFNMWWLKDLGSWIENKEGRKPFIWMVLSISCFSNLAQYVVSGPFFGGMSGVNFGLLAYIWIRGRVDPRSGYYIDQTTVVIMGIWFFLGWFQVVPGMANIVHTFGLLGGVVWAYARSAKG